MARFYLPSLTPLARAARGFTSEPRNLPLKDLQISALGRSMGLACVVYIDGSGRLRNTDNIPFGIEHGTYPPFSVYKGLPAVRFDGTDSVSATIPSLKLDVQNWTALVRVNRQAAGETIFQIGTSANYWIAAASFGSAGIGEWTADDDSGRAILAVSTGSNFQEWMDGAGTVSPSDGLLNGTGVLGYDAFPAFSTDPTPSLTSQTTNGFLELGGGTLGFSNCYFAHALFFNRSHDVETLNWIRANLLQLVEPANQSPVLIGTAAAGGADNLLADNIESATEVSAPAIGQTHAITASDIESAVEISAPVLGQTHALTVVSLESATELSAPALAEGADHNLLAEDIESATELSSPAIGQAHVLTAFNLESAIVISSPVLGQVHALTSVSVESATVLSAPTLVDSGSITNAQIWAKLVEIHKILGLDATAPMTVTPTSRTAGDISQTISGDGVTSTTVTRD